MRLIFGTEGVFSEDFELRFIVDLQEHPHLRAYCQQVFTIAIRLSILE